MKRELPFVSLSFFSSPLKCAPLPSRPSEPGPCTCSGASRGCCSTTCWFTDPPAAGPSWQRRAAWKQGRGSAASGAEAAVSPGSPAWPIEASALRPSVPLNRVRVPPSARKNNLLEVMTTSWYCLLSPACNWFFDERFSLFFCVFSHSGRAMLPLL